MPKIMLLSHEDQKFVPEFVKASGSIKFIAEQMSLSYPTARNILDDLIEKIKNWKANLMVSIFNPFKRIAGGKALVSGIIIAFLTLVISSYSKATFDGPLDFHVALYGTIWPCIIFNQISWLCLIIYFGLAGCILTSIKFRWLDLLGTTLLSRLPLFFVVLLSFAIPHIDKKQLHDLTAIHFRIDFFIASILSLLAFIWCVALYYNSYRISINIKGTKAIWSCVLTILLTEITSIIIIYSLHFK